MTTGPKTPGKPWGYEHVVYSFFGGAGAFLGIWIAVALGHEWNHGSIPDAYGAFIGMGCGYAVAAILNGMIVGMRSAK